METGRELRATGRNRRYLDEVADFIFVEDAPEQADVIVIAGSPRREPVLRAAELFREGFAPFVLPTGRFGQRFADFREEIARVAKKDGGDPAAAFAEIERQAAQAGREDFPETEWAYQRNLLLAEGVQDTAILREDQSVNTFENAIFARRCLEARGDLPKTMLLCCQAFHARRALMTFSTEFANTKILVCPGITRNLSRETWLSSADLYDKVFDELEKCGAYFRGERMYGALK